MPSKYGIGGTDISMAPSPLWRVTNVTTEENSSLVSFASCEMLGPSRNYLKTVTGGQFLRQSTKTILLIIFNEFEGVMSWLFRCANRMQCAKRLSDFTYIII